MMKIINDNLIIELNDEIENEFDEIINNNIDIKNEIVDYIIDVELKKYNDINIYIQLIHELINYNEYDEFIENYIVNEYNIDIIKKIQLINQYNDDNKQYKLIINKNDENE